MKRRFDAISWRGHIFMDSRMSYKRLICLGLVLSVLAVYGRTTLFDFVYFDDHVYVMEKAQVISGLSPASLQWAFTATDAGFWHPLTWISLMIDHDLWGMNPGGYHLTNLLLHAAATLFLFAALHRLTGTIWKSGIVAGLFALHPLHVESVAWIAERKDVLSGLFWMISLYLYGRYAEMPGWRRYGLVLLSFIGGLMSKPMVVTLPIVLLLIDYWPLGRLSRETWRRALLEKVPFFVLGVASGVVTIMAEQQVGALKSLEEFSAFARLTNAVAAYGFYVYKTILPFNLAVHYPHPGVWPWDKVVLALIVLGAVTFFAVQKRRSCPAAIVGWIWYLVCLIPVIGLIQIGSHAYADRYTYIPLTGLFIAIVWGAEAWGGVSRRRQASVMVLAVAVTAGWALTSVMQLRHWQNGETLFRRAVAVTQDNYLARNNLGAALSRQGRHAEALVQFDQALMIRPDYTEALFNKGVALAGQGRYREAVVCYQQVLSSAPRFAAAHNNIAVAYAHIGDIRHAIVHFREATIIDPAYEEAVRNLKLAEAERDATSLPSASARPRR